MKKSLMTGFMLLLLTTSALAGLRVNQAAPDFSLMDIDGKQFNLSEMVGKENTNPGGVILNFFASWCGPCRDELPILNSAADKLKKKGITIVLIGVKDEVSPIKNLLRALKVNKPVVLNDHNGKVFEKYGVRAIPTTFFIGADGRVKNVLYGEILNEQELMNGAHKLLQK